MEHVVDTISLENFTNSIVPNSQYLIQDFSGQLFHYTDLNALTSIIGNNDLWLTNSQYSNDSREMKHGYDIAKVVIEEKRNESEKQAFEKYLELVAKYVDEKAKGVYICCFCEKDNLLSQWRSYGENGTGVSIGFDPRGFAFSTGSDLPSTGRVSGVMGLWKVYYDLEDQKNIVELALELIPKLNPNDSNDVQARKAADAIHFFVPTFKNKDFEGEHERRLMFTPSPECQVKPSFRVRKGMLIPYYSFKALRQETGELPINQITLGPSALSTLNLESANMLLQQKGYENVSISVSETPYRG